MSKQSLQGEKNQNIKVYVRCRPINDQERKARSPLCVDVVDARRAITVKSHHDKTFTFDGAFGKDSSQIDIYKTVVQPLISEVLQGYNCTVFAYGQTGTGKTYTMEGVRSEQLLSWQHDPHAGIVPRALHQIFSEVGDPALTIIKVSFLELYNEELFDLLGSGDHNTKLKIFEDSSAKGSVVVRGLEEVIVRDRQEVYALMERGASRRQVAATLMNASSSRSHTIFTITVISKDTTDKGEGLMRTGKLNLVDLAGSENIGRSGAQDKRAREAGNINQSLLTLGRVITALVERTPHVPYRESKLTRLLQDSLGGRTKTSIIATISPAQVNIEETLSTLEYAFRAKNITNRPEVNQKLCKEVVLKHMTDELEQLRRDLIACREKNGFYIDETNYRDMQSRLDLQSEELQRKTQEMTDMAERIDLLKTQIAEITNLFETTQHHLEIRTTEMNRVQNRLKEVNYNYTGAKVLIQAHKVTEEKLHEDATKIMQSLKMASTDATLLHEKVQRQSEVAQSNQSVIERIMGALSSGLDSSLRGVDDALSTLYAVSTLEKGAIEGLAEEGRLIKETDCLVASIVRAQEQRRADFVANLKDIERRANDIVAVLPKRGDKLASAVETAYESMRNALTENLVSEVKALRTEAVTELDNLTATLNLNKSTAEQLQEKVTGELTKLDTERDEMIKCVSLESTNAKELVAGKCDQLEGLIEELDSVKSRMATYLMDLRGAPPIHDKICTIAENASREASVRAQAVNEVVNGHVKILKKQSEDATERAVALKANIVARQGSLEDAVRIRLEQFTSEINDCSKEIHQTFDQTVKDVADNMERVASESAKMMSAAPSERKNIAAVCEKTNEASVHVQTTMHKLRELKTDTLSMLRENVKICTPTGSTPIKRSYDAPRKVASTQPAAILLNRLQARYERATSEERCLLDEGHSILLDVSASPEMVALADESHDLGHDFYDENKENSSFCE